ncbi:MAG: Pr2TM family membrane protein [bacterium]|nr:Pr2TM family membrane protein [bacterium]
MSREEDGSRKRGSRSNRRSRPKRRRKKELTPEEQAYREARERAEKKLKFVQHFVSYFFVCIFLLFVTGRFVATMVALGWGIGLASHFFQAIIAPDLRKRWVRSEVDRAVANSVTRERRVLEDEKLRSLEELSASIAHEIRNPITAAKSLVQQMGEDPSSGENVEYADVALEELDRVERSISHLLRYAREEAMASESIRMSEVIDSALDSLGDRLEALGVNIERHQDTEGEMVGDPEKLRRVLINLVGNAIDAFEEADTSSPALHISMGENLAGTDVWVRVKDNGPGIDEETQARIFTPFFTSKANGTGLGLAITRKLVDAHGGEIEIGSSPGNGTEFVVQLPKHPIAEEIRS